MESNEIQQLKSQLAALQNRLNELEAADEPVRANRRGMLKLAAGAAVGAAAGAVGLGASPASAADLDPIRISGSTSSTSGSRDSTEVIYANTNDAPRGNGIILGTYVETNAFLVRDEAPGLVLFKEYGSAYPAASAGYAYGVLKNGVYGYSQNANGYGVAGFSGASTGGAGVLARGTHANLELHSFGDAPAARTAAYLKGQVICDSSGDTWICVVAGTPGTWRKVSGAATAGAFHAINPIRVYDSRQAGYSGNNGSLARTASREISVADARDGGGTVVTANAVPAGATAVAFNITSSGPTANNYLSITPGGVTTTPTTSILNFSAGQEIANASVVAISSDRKVKVWCGDMAGSTDFILDISGYYL